MGYAHGIGRVGALAVALGVGMAISATPGFAYAAPEASDSTDSDSPPATDEPTSDSPTPDGSSTADDVDPEDATEDDEGLTDDVEEEDDGSTRARSNDPTPPDDADDPTDRKSVV